MEYEEMLKRGIEKLPKKIESKERFEIPQAVYEISGNKTIIKNFEEIANTLRRDPLHFSKFLFRELAAPGIIEKGTLVLQGRIPKESLQRKINDYVKEFVYCKKCGKPDTMLVKDNGNYVLACEACGSKFPARSI